jgi:uncharacterized protein GlcG (DUF336 family)
MVFAGSVPLQKDGKVVGAVGGFGDDDILLAEAAASGF